MKTQRIIAAATLAAAGLFAASCQDTSALADRDATQSSSRSSGRSSSSDGPGFIARTFSHSGEMQLPAGTAVSVRLTDSVSSDTRSSGADVAAVVANSVTVDGKVVIPAGARVNAQVIEAQPAKHFGGKALITVEARSIELPHESVALDGSATAAADSEKGEDTAIIAGSAGGGALLGKILGGDNKDAAVGAVVAGGIGTAVASRKGHEAVLPAGTIISARTTSDEWLEVNPDLSASR